MPSKDQKAAPQASTSAVPKARDKVTITPGSDAEHQSNGLQGLENKSQTTASGLSSQKYGMPYALEIISLGCYEFKLEFMQHNEQAVQRIVFPVLQGRMTVREDPRQAKTRALLREPVMALKRDWRR